MKMQVTAPTQTELEERRARLLRLHWELKRIGACVRARKPRNGRWRLHIRHDGWSETVLCAGAEGTYAYVTAHGRLLGTTNEARYVARLLVWMVQRRRR
ncbi:hypothetical protein F8568_022420 [Actinomadura sp. LD22]|jgi:hypothetical protein|uniref:Uncharacterized protein n=1 Tax=Actinomadura physcomitrii TaxID=2650748 RepID=A0A6I4MI92_9ACTN|nr:hypothetical protein [Actinomadura physcomitrii]MWA02349.1 hypothetical protein [Actinomadura physcomitrii]MWA03079.1 hypothetical protein [Actinomadura physcomitrii]